MNGSSYGKAFHITTWGESHGKAIGVTVQGCPPGIRLDEADIQAVLDQRKPFTGPGSTSRKEPDKAIILSGVFKGQTTGTPITIMIQNTDARSADYSEMAHVFRPGHGDITYHQKYFIRDYQGGGRASARETAARVAAGGVAKALLLKHQIEIVAYTIEINGICALKTTLTHIHENRLKCPDNTAAQKMEQCILKAKKAGDSVGGVVEILALNVPPGLGDPVFDKLDADIAKGLMSIGAVKAVDIGAGHRAARMTGSQNNDEITPQGFASNNSGGILAGISNGDTIVARAYVKPIPSIKIEQTTIDDQKKRRQISTKGRHDVCAIPRINPVCAAMMQITIADHLLRQQALGLKPVPIF